MKKISILIICSFVAFFSKAQTIFLVDKVPISTPSEANIYIAGNFNNWNPGDTDFVLQRLTNGRYFIQMNYSLGTQIEYKFTLGSWETVEKSTSGSEINNRKFTFDGTDTLRLQIANWANTENTETSHTAAENVAIMSDSFYMPQFNRYRRIWIYLPPNYDSTSVSFPVIYMHDGQNLFDNATSFAGEWNVDESLNELFAEGHKVPIVVGIDNGGVYRTCELTPYTNAKYGGGCGDLYMQFIINTLKPYIDKNFRTLSDRKNTAIWGSSLGGLISLYGVLSYSDIFSMAGVYSPSLWFNDSINTLAENYIKTQDIKIFFLAGGMEGDGTLPQQCRDYINILKSRGVNDALLKLKSVASGEHNEAFWRSQYKETYLWLFENVSSVFWSKSSDLFLLYPNPGNKYIRIKAKNSLYLFDYQVYSLNGELMLSKTKRRGSDTLNVKNFKQGIYLLKVNQNNKIWTTKFQVN